jgi:hypothetical protein
VVIAFLLVLGTLFEMLWAFHYWFATYTLDVIHGNEENVKTLDYTDYDVLKDSTDYYFYKNMYLNTSAKIHALFFMMSVYLLYYLLVIKHSDL